MSLDKRGGVKALLRAVVAEAPRRADLHRRNCHGAFAVLRRIRIRAGSLIGRTGAVWEAQNGRDGLIGCGCGAEEILAGKQCRIRAEILRGLDDPEARRRRAIGDELRRSAVRRTVRAVRETRRQARKFESVRLAGRRQRTRPCAGSVGNDLIDFATRRVEYRHLDVRNANIDGRGNRSRCRGVSRSARVRDRRCFVEIAIRTIVLKHKATDRGDVPVL